MQQKNVDVNERKQKKSCFRSYDDIYTEEKYILHCAIENGNNNIIKLLLTNENLDVNCVKKYIVEKQKPEKLRCDMIYFHLGTEWVPWDEWDTDYYVFSVEMTALNYAVEMENIEIVH